MPKCEKCGTDHKKSDLFCSKCGVEIVKKKAATDVGVSEKSPPKKEKTALSEDVKKKIKTELENSIKAFKRGEMTLEEFQDVKKDIVTKARTGGYKKTEAYEIPKKTIEEPYIDPLPPPTTIQPSGELHRPLRREDEPPFSKLWYLAPILLNIIGGVIAYLVIKKVDEKSAMKMVTIGMASLIVVGGGGGYILLSQKMWPFEKKVEIPTGIVVVGEDLIIDLEPLIHTNSTPKDMNIGLDDVEGGFVINSLLTGTLKDPVEFAAGNSSFAGELRKEGWLENHRIVMKKDGEGSGENITAVKEIDSSISKYDTNKSSRTFFEKQLALFLGDIEKAGYTSIEFKINDSGVMGKKVESHPEYEVKVSYMVIFYRYDSIVKLSISKVGRGLEEEDVVGYAHTIEGRIR